MIKTNLEQFNDKSKDLLYWIKNHLSKKIYKLKTNKGFTTEKDKTDEDTKYFDRQLNFDLLLNSITIEELKDNANKIALSMSGLRNYSSPLISFYNHVANDKKIHTLKKIDTNYIHTYTKLNKLSSNYYVQIKSLFSFIDKNMSDDYKFDVGFKKDGTKAKRPVKFAKEKTYNYLEPKVFAEFVKSIDKYKSNHPNAFVLRLLVKFLCFGGFRADEVQHIKEDDISFKTIDKKEYMQIFVLGKGDKERFIYILFDLIKEDYNSYIKIKEEKKHNCEYLFYTRDFKMFSDKRIYDIVKDFNVKSGLEIPSFSAHVLRRSMSSYLHFRGVKLEIISKILGHSDEETVDFYVFASSENSKKVSKLFKFI